MAAEPGDDLGGRRTGWRAARPTRRRRPPGRRSATRPALVALLAGALGFAAAAQARSTSAEDLAAGASQQELATILSDLSASRQRLSDEIGDLERLRTDLGRSADSSDVAVRAARRQTQALQVLAGVSTVRGKGVQVTFAELEAKLPAAVVLEALQEFRDAGAEALQIEGATDSGRRSVRVVASTYVYDAPAGLDVGGTRLRSPYRVSVVGPPAELAGRLAVPGGIRAVAKERGVSVEVVQLDSVVIDATRTLDEPRYARPAGDPEG